MSRYADGSGNYDKDRRRAKLRRDKERRQKKLEKASRRRTPIAPSRSEQADFGWN